MTFDSPNFGVALPEMVLLGFAVLALMLEVFKKPSCKHVVYWVSIVGLAVTALLVLANFSLERTESFSGAYVKDGLSDTLKGFILLLTMGVFVMSRDYLVDRNMYRGEYFVLAMLGVLGLMVMTSAHDFILMYVGMELAALAMYTLIAMGMTSDTAKEAAIKYFILGAMASGLLLFGISMIYGATGSLQFDGVLAGTVSTQVNTLLLSFGLVFFVMGAAFKLGAAPFHMWLPDVYDGAPTAVTLYLSAAPVLGVFALLYRPLLEGLLPVADVWQDFLTLMVVVSLIVGNVVAIAQDSFKRMLAYATISHVGFILLGLLAATEAGASAALFYAIAYAVMTLAGFGLILALASKGFEADQIKDLRGMGKQHPWIALMMLIVLFSMAGVPPTVGFYAKVLVLQAAVSADFLWLAVFAVVMSIIGLFYYLRIIKTMYFDASDHPQTDNHVLTQRWDMRLVLTGVALLILYWGILPAGLINLTNNVI